MPIKSTATNKYKMACFIQEAPTLGEIKPGSLVVKTSADGHPYCKFRSTLQTFEAANRMRRRYDGQNVANVIRTCERINDLKKRNQWRGEWNHPNPDIEGTKLTNIRMTIPDPKLTSHFINNDGLFGMKYDGDIVTHPGTECGRAIAAEIIDLKAVPAFSVRLLGNMIPNARPGDVNIKVNKVITFDMVDFPSHPGAVADIVHQESAEVIFLRDLARYAVEQSEVMSVVCEAFEISLDEISGIHNGHIVVEQADVKMMLYPSEANIRRELTAGIFGRENKFKS